MNDRRQLEAGIAALEAQRATLGDALVDLAVAPLRASLAALSAAAAPARPEQALKQVSVLFTDVVGSTALSQHLDPEDIHAIMDGALQRFTEIVTARGGRVLQYAGDSVLAVFGADEAQEDDAERAVRAGLEVLEEGRRQGEQVLQQTGHAGFNVRVGIDTGPVLLGGGVDAEGSIRGITVNMAARMEQSAPPGCLRISHATYRLVRGVFSVVEQPPLQVKGHDDALVTYLVQSVKPRAFRVQSRGIEGVETRMVGREAELEQLQEAFRSLYEQRELAVVTVVGDAGVGKSRLLYEFENWAEAQAETYYFFRGRAHPQALSQPYGLLRDVLAWRLQIADDDDAGEARAKLVRGVASLFTEDGEAQAHLLGQLIGMDFADSPHVRGVLDDARQIRNRGFHAAAQVLRLTAALDGSPVMLLLEDLHWADEGSLDFINYLTQVNRDVPMLMVCLTRPTLFERRPSWAEVGGAGHARIDLEPLDQRASRELAGVLLQRLDRVPPVLRELLTGGAEGNPFYMEELLRMLIDHGAIQAGGERWQVVPEKLLATQVPPSLTGVLQARLDRLPAAERQALQLASVIGFVFWDQALAALDPLAADALDAPVQRGLVVPRDHTSFDGLREFSFKHQLLHHVAYDSVLKRDRRAGHARVAHWLAGLGGDRAGEILGQTADHFERAGDPANACLFYTRAAEHAAARFANEAVLDYVRRALALVPAEDHAARWRLLLARESVLLFQGDRVAHGADLDALQSLADTLNDDARRCEVALRRTRALNSNGDHPEAERVARLGLALAQRCPGAAALVPLHSTLANALVGQGEYAAARQVAEQGLALAREQGDRPGESSLINAIGVIAMEQGDLTVAAQSLERSLLLERETGNRAREGLRLNNLGSVYPRLGDYAKARQHLADGLKLARAVGRREVEAGVLLNTASVAHLQGDDASALAYANAAFEAARATGQPDLEAYARLVAGHAELGLGRFDAARTAYTDSRDRLGALKIRSQQALDPLSGLVRVAMAEGNRQQASLLAEPIVAHLAAGGSLDGTEEPLLIPLSCYQALAAAGDPRATEVLRSAHAELQRQAERITEPEARRGFLQQVPHHREISEAWSRLQQQQPA